MTTEKNLALCELLAWSVREGVRLRDLAHAQPATPEGLRIATNCVGGVEALNRMCDEIKRIGGVTEDSSALPAEATP